MGQAASCRRTVATVLLLAATGCGEDDVGTPCQLGATAAPGVVHVNPRAFDCRSRLCVAISPGDQQQPVPLCSRICEDEAECPDSTDSCPAGFACVHTKNTGDTACCRMCVCRGLLPDGEAAALEAHCAANPNPRCPASP